MPFILTQLAREASITVFIFFLNGIKKYGRRSALLPKLINYSVTPSLAFGNDYLKMLRDTASIQQQSLFSLLSSFEQEIV